MAIGAACLSLAFIGYQAKDNNIVGVVLAFCLATAFVITGVRRLLQPKSNPSRSNHAQSQTVLERCPPFGAEKVLHSLKRISFGCLFIWPFVLLGSFMAFDAPNSEHKLGPWLFVGFVLFLPVLIWLMPRFAQQALASGRTKLAYFLAVVPILPFALPLLHYVWLITIVTR